jgi:pimeloyl-ACP methyl ester carboxylesterase
MTKIAYRRIAVDSIEIFYREAGRSNAPALLLLHGFPTSSHMFRDLIPQLADRFHVIAPDLPGRHLLGETAVPVYPGARSRRRDHRDRWHGRWLAGRAAGVRGAAQRWRLRRRNRTRRRCRGADPRGDGFCHRRRLPGCLWHLAFRADPSRPLATGRDAAGARRRRRGRADSGRARQGDGGAGHRRGWCRGKTGSGERAGRRRANRLSTREHPRPGARADRWQRRRCRLRPGRR